MKEEPGITVAEHILSAPAGPAVDAACTIDLVSWGVPFRLAAETPILLDRMRKLAPFGSVPCPHPSASAHTVALHGPHSRTEFQLFCNQELIAEEVSLDALLDQLGGHLIIHVAEHAPDYIFVHAGVVAWRGRAIILPGVSFAGKSSLVAELVRAGATYYSDEFALIDQEGLVHPFLRELRMRRPDRPEQMPVPIDQLQGLAGTGAIPIGLIVFTQFEANARWTPEPLSPGRAALELLLHTLPVQRTPARVLATFSAVMNRARAWRSPRGEATDVVSSLLSALEAEGELL